jgi:hypothetical protein
MENYVIRFNETEREEVLDILSRSNDIIINHVEPDSVGITIQLDESDQAYRALLDQIDRELHAKQIIVVREVIVKQDTTQL